VSVRSFRASDAASIAAILNAIVAHGDAFVYDTPFTPDSARAWIESHVAGFVAEQDGAVVAGYVLQPNQPGRGSHVCNAAYLVAESARGRGLGRLLGEHSLVEAKRLGFSAMQFNAVVATNTSAIRLWRGLGFETIGTLPGAFRDGGGRFVDLHVMYRAL
jgi:L-amino acid N-acyltransferase YncA